MLTANLAFLALQVYAAMPTTVAYYDASRNWVSEVEFTGLGFTSPSNVPFFRIGGNLTTNVLKIWVPFSGGLPVSILLTAAQDYVIANRDSNGNPTFAVEIKSGAPVASGVICQGTGECPDLIMTNNFQIASRVNNSDFLSLNSYFAKYNTTYGVPFESLFLPNFKYDYQYNGQWMGIPILADTRHTYFNKTTFDAVGLKYPPPFTTWAPGTWNWKKFAEYAAKIRADGYDHGYSLAPGWDEEKVLITLAMRDYNISLLNSTSQCGLLAPEFVTMLDEVIRPMFGSNTSAANRNFLTLTNSEVTTWMNAPLGGAASITGSGSGKSDVLGITYDGSSPWYWANTWNGDVNATATQYIGRAYMPGDYSHLESNGISITALSKNPNLAWGFIVQYSMDKYMAKWSTGYGQLAPFYRTLLRQVNNTADGPIRKYDILRGVPIQYPLTSFPQMGALESRKPFRNMLMEMMYKNVSSALLATRVCNVINAIFPLPVATTTGVSTVGSTSNASAATTTNRVVTTIDSVVTTPKSIATTTTSADTTTPSVSSTTGVEVLVSTTIGSVATTNASKASTTAACSGTPLAGSNSTGVCSSAKTFSISNYLLAMVAVAVIL